MKYLRIMTVTLLLSVFLVSTAFSALAMDIEFATNSVSQEYAEGFSKNVSIALINDEPSVRPITKFAVRDDGVFALCWRDGTEKTIGIFDQNGAFLYGYVLIVNGAIALDWDRENLVVIFVRSDTAVSITPQGTIDEVCEISKTTENTYLWNRVLHRTEVSVGSSTYKIKNHLGVFSSLRKSYSQLTVVTENGQEAVLYDAGTGNEIASLIWVIAVIAAVALVGRQIVVTLIKRRKTQDSGSEQY